MAKAEFTPEEIRAIRKKTGVGIKTFARLINVDRDLVSKWETGEL